MGGYKGSYDDDISGTGTVTGASPTLDIDIDGYHDCVLQILGTFTGTISFLATVDGSTYLAANAINRVTGQTATSITVGGEYIIPCSAISKIRLSGSPWTSGTANVYWILSEGSSAIVPMGSDGTALKSLLTDSAGRLINVIYEPGNIGDCVHFNANLTNAGSDSMSVNGSITPVYFTYAPAANETAYVTDLDFQILDSGNTTGTNFGALSPLTNGITLQIRVKGVDYTSCVLKTNLDIMRFFNHYGIIPPTSGFIEQSDGYNGAVEFHPPMALFGATSDYIRFKVNDNLTSIDYLRASTCYYRYV
jgi:hypothetical protein